MKPSRTLEISTIVIGDASRSQRLSSVTQLDPSVTADTLPTSRVQGTATGSAIKQALSHFKDQNQGADSGGR